MTINSQTDKHTLTPPLISVVLLSATALAYEILLIRLFSIIHWYHFAFMVISIALLGYGVSGSMITVFRRRLLQHYDTVFISNILLFGLSTIVCFITVQLLPFNALEILWDNAQWQRLFWSYLLLTLPFFFVANALALTIMHFHQHIPQVYGFDLIGAGLGAVLVMILLQLLSPDNVLRGISIGALTAGFFALRQLRRRKKQITVCLLMLSISAVVITPQHWLDLRLSEYKGLSQTLLTKEAELIQRQNSPLAQIDVVRSTLIPFRYAPGLSLQSPAGPPEQLAVFRDGEQMTVIDKVTDRRSLEYHDYMSSALPYHVHNNIQNVLILNSATGASMLQADYHNIPVIDAVEPNRQLSLLLSETYANYFGWHKLKQKVTIHTIAARGFATTQQNYDLVLIGPGGGSSASLAGVDALSTAYDYTIDALQSYLDLLSPGGMLSITLGTSNPARANLKLFATAVSAMKRSGIDLPENKLVWIRSWNTATLLIKTSPLSREEINRVRIFNNERSFDLAWLPDIQEEEVNRFQLLQEPVFYLAARSLLNRFDDTRLKEDFIEQYKYDIRPATDNSPYFYHYFRWSSLKELISLPGKAGLSLIGVGYPTLLFTLIQALFAAIVLILLPLAFVPSKKKQLSNRRRHIFIYYLAIGLAFLFIELAFIQKLTLIVSQPLYAVAVVLSAFLIFSGLGSLYVQHRLRLKSNRVIPDLLRQSVIAIAIITVIYSLILPLINHNIMALPESARITIAFVIASLPAFFMGMPFPLGLASLQQTSSHIIPWAWAINGCASVLSSILAVLLAIEIGFNGVLLCAVLLYLIAWISNARWLKQSTPNN